MATEGAKHKWEFRARFRRHSFGWRSQPAIKRVKEAVSEIKKVARTDPVLAAEGAVVFLSKVSPAIEHVDSSSGSIGTAVNKAIVALVPVISGAPADRETRDAWLERLFEAHAADGIPFIEGLAEYWGELCAAKDVASHWADRLMDVTRMALSPDKEFHGLFHGTSACLSALYAAERYEELVDILEAEGFWPYRRWAVKGLASQGKNAEAVRYAESSRSPWASDQDIDELCEEILLSSGLVDDAYRRYGLTANRSSTYLAWFRKVVKKYPHKQPEGILADLAEITPGEEGKWFAAAKSVRLFDEAIVLANRSPCDPRTLSRAARDFAEENPTFAIESGMAALHWLLQGYGYEITRTDVWTAYADTMTAAANAGRSMEIRARVEALVEAEAQPGDPVAGILSRELGLS